MKKSYILLSSLALTATNMMAQQHPNVIYVFPDQFRNCALNFWNQPEYRKHVLFQADPTYTPNIDQFAHESIVLTSAMSNFPLSSPHRGSLLTGMYPNQSGVSLNCNSDRPFSSIRNDIEWISDVMSQAGYDCAYIGKLHAETPTRNDPERPGHYVEDRDPAWDAYTAPEHRHGFNYWYSYGTFDEHKNPHYWDTNGHKHEPHEWSPLHEAKKAIAYIQNKDQERDGKKPFFMMIGMNPPHSPYRSLDDCMKEDYQRYANIPIDSLLIRPNANKDLEKAPSVRYYFASVTGVDRAFGEILQALKEAGLEKNTIVVFASDHGETMCSQNTEDPKNSPYTESMNIPFIVRYPGKIRPHVDDLLLSSPDIMPTLLGLAGLGDRIPKNVQGKDYSALFLYPQAKVKRPDAALYLQNINGEKGPDHKIKDYFPSARGIKTAGYTLALYINKKNQLTKVLFFNDQKDPYQMHPLKPEEQPKAFNKLAQRMGELLKEIDDPWYQHRVLSSIINYH